MGHLSCSAGLGQSLLSSCTGILGGQLVYQWWGWGGWWVV